MAEQYKRSLWLIVLIVVIGAGGLALVRARTEGISDAGAIASGTSHSSASDAMLSAQESRQSSTHRNLSLNSEAFNVGRLLGQRFSPGKREQSILAGTLTVGSEQRTLQTTRIQTDEGEQVAIEMAGASRSLTWDAAQGARSGAGRATGGDRELVERFVLDSPDQFVLAQLRGAGYSTVSRNTRPSEARDGYEGPLWNIVRVDDPDRDQDRRPQSSWRLYYINTRTGLIDKVESEVEGQRFVTQFSGWTNQSGEQLPTQITWTRDGQTVMQFSLTSFSHDAAVRSN